MRVEEFLGIVMSLQEENRGLKKQVEVMEDILHSYLPIIENENKEK